MAHVFISYSRDDSDFVDTLKQRLEAIDCEVWVDTDFLIAGEDWRKEIDDGIKKSFALIVVMSPKAIQSQYVTYEWAFALGMGVKVIPVLKKAAKLHPVLYGLQYIDAKDKNFWDVLAKRVLGLKDSYSLPKPAQETDPNLQYLLESLKNPNREKRRNAIKALGSLGSKFASEYLIKLLQEDPAWSVRMDAAEALGRIKSDKAYASLIHALYSESGTHVVANIAWSLSEYENPKAAISLIEAFERHKDDSAKISIVNALGKLANKEVVPQLIQGVKYSSLYVQAAIAKTLGLIGDERAVPVLQGMLSRNDIVWHDRINRTSLAEIAFQALEQIGTKEALAIANTWWEEHNSQMLQTEKVMNNSTKQKKKKPVHPATQQLLNHLHEFILTLGNDIEVKNLKLYTAYKRDKNFACVHADPKSITVWLKVNPDEVELEKGFTRDVRSIGHWGTGDLEITIKNQGDIEKAKELIKRSYEGT